MYNYYNRPSQYLVNTKCLKWVLGRLQANDAISDIAIAVKVWTT